MAKPMTDPTPQTRPAPEMPEIDDLARRVAAGERRALSRAITLVESTRPDHRAQARHLLAQLPPPPDTTRRIGLSGTPGVGKSTFIEALGMQLVESGDRVAVLAVDPSSARSGGSILGDKTRMEQLSRHPSAFIRPSPSLGDLGGVARRTREAVRLAEAAGFGTVLIETVGVGQSETLVAEMTDIFVLLMAPAGGDELQGVKRGIMEIADLILVNKADGALEPVAAATRSDYAGALRLMRGRAEDPEGYPAARTVSARTGAGMEDAWDAIARLHDWRRDKGWIAKRRAGQAVTAMDRAVREGALAALLSRPDVADLAAQLREQVSTGDIGPEDAADRLIALITGR